ncbi:TPA: restriction endonuclease subunit S [Bacillus cereus]|nr:restriction endonuclease subunit S [Bacillus cereus]HDR8265256.1 restriction endonuclease subunit S [Bacillus cereus]HDR8269330.1 restriction endonuclease subunit S [Bacillus cereus]HDR8275134.1 restriction endonuclease subunit S [Bacillus cereus]HDR8282043.1 restriction endonuclease subunit S [Bacillus cereus]
MIKPNYMSRLLEGVEVKWKTLGKIADLKRGRVMSKAYLIENKGNYPVFSSQTANNGMIGSISTFDFDGEYVNWTTDGANAGTVFYRTGKFSITNVSGLIKLRDSSELNYKFLFHWLSIEAKKHVYKGMGNPKLMSHQMEKVPIPIPPLKVQEEIVRILDDFIELTAELTAELAAELAAHKKQYEYYRYKLLTFEEAEVEWKTLKEVSLEFGRGKSKHRPRNDSKLYGGTIPFIQTGDISKAPHIIREFTQTYSKFGLEQSKLWPKGTLCITIAANIAETAILGFDSCFPDSVIGFVANPQKTNSSYVEYLLTSYKAKLQSKSTGSAQENINLSTFENLPLPFPALAEQERIVSILEKFDALTSSIIEDLRREIELRQKQYEYYRNMLLSFPKSEVKA